MIREYCDNCKREITREEKVEVSVSISDKNREHNFNYSSDDICRECARNFIIHVESEILEKKPE